VNIILVFMFVIGLPLVTAFSTFRAARILRLMNVEPLMYKNLPSSVQIAEHKKKKTKKSKKTDHKKEEHEQEMHDHAGEPQVVVEDVGAMDAPRTPARVAQGDAPHHIEEVTRSPNVNSTIVV
jgi:ABC-type Zn2+ transport system substrate-binding protein/surface adhesin